MTWLRFQQIKSSEQWQTTLKRWNLSSSRQKLDLICFRKLPSAAYITSWGSQDVIKYLPQTLSLSKPRQKVLATVMGQLKSQFHEWIPLRGRKNFKQTRFTFKIKLRVVFVMFFFALLCQDYVETKGVGIMRFMEPITMNRCIRRVDNDFDLLGRVKTKWVKGRVVWWD